MSQRDDIHWDPAEGGGPASFVASSGPLVPVYNHEFTALLDDSYLDLQGIRGVELHVEQEPFQRSLVRALGVLEGRKDLSNQKSLSAVHASGVTPAQVLKDSFKRSKELARVDFSL